MKHICIKCQKQFEEDSLINFTGDWVCVECKPEYVQCLKEGVPDQKRKRQVPKHAYRALGVILAASFLMTIPSLVKWSSMIIPGQGRGFTPMINLVGLGSYIVAVALFAMNNRLAPWALLISFIFGFLGLMISYIPFIVSVFPTAVRLYVMWGLNAAVIVTAFVLRPRRQGEHEPDSAG